MDIEFNPYEDGKFLESKLSYEAVCYEADIAIDAILSYPWLAQNKIGVFPHHKALVVDEPRLLLLYGQKEKGKTQPQGSRRQVRQVTRLEACTDLKYPIRLPMVGLQVVRKPLNAEELNSVMRRINLIEAQEPVGEEDPRILALREKIFKDFDGTVFRDKVFPNPPERGQFGYAYIHLKEGAQPIRQKPYFLHGERQEAYKRVVQDWIDNEFIERPTKGRGEWLSQGFVVPKKSADFPWRGGG